MPKNRNKSRKKEQHGPAIPLASSLRPRLDALLNDSHLSQQDDEAVYADLDAVTQGIKPVLFLPTMLRAYDAAPAAVQVQLDETLPAWLADRGLGTELETLIAHGALDYTQQEWAMRWLETVGRDRDALATLAHWEPFFRADFRGDESQAALILLWYTTRQQQRVQGYNFLIDYNPPWDGSIKDIILYPQRAPQTAVAEFVDIWKARLLLPVQQLNAVETKETILDALMCNRSAQIRLPEELIASRDLFVRNVLSLPDGPETPDFTVEDFEFLCHNGERPETLMRIEQTVGRRVRTSDGKEVVVLGGGLD